MSEVPPGLEIPVLFGLENETNTSDHPVINRVKVSKKEKKGTINLLKALSDQQTLGQRSPK